MALIEIKDLEKAYAGQPVLRGLRLDIQKGERIGLIGPNGAGKTTLLRILAGVESADHGAASIARAATFHYVPQVPTLDPEETLRHQVALVFEELREIERQMHAAADLLAQHTAGPEHDRALERYGELEAHFQHRGGYDSERRVESVLDQLGFAQSDLELPIKALSGGQKSRAQIARLLLEAPDLMLLDEPTNHLDLPMLDWLEALLNEMSDVTMLVVSHDRYFLDSVVDEIYDLRDGRVEQYPGNYSAYLELRAERQLAIQRTWEQQQGYIAKQEEFIRRFQANQRARQARGRRTRLERLKRDSLARRPDSDGKTIHLNLEIKKPSGVHVLKVEDLAKSFPGKTLFEELALEVLRGKRLGIIGPNGSGKSTLLNVLGGDLPADAGTIKWGHGVVRQYYRQEQQDLNPANTVLDELQALRITATQQELRDLAALFLFSGETSEKKIEILSGGEKARVALARLLLNPANTILMDEPTNHLDMTTCEVLEEALDSYDGTLILVSHDRYFLDQVCDYLLVLQPVIPSAEGHPTWRLYRGSYTDYLAAVAKDKAAALEEKREAERAERKKEHERQAQARAREQAAKAPMPKPSGQYARLTLAEIEKQIIDLESRLAHTEASFANPQLAANLQAMRQLKAKYEADRQTLAELNAAWETKAESA